MKKKNIAFAVLYAVGAGALVACGTSLNGNPTHRDSSTTGGKAAPARKGEVPFTSEVEASMEPDDFSAAEAEDRRERKCAQELGMDMRELRVLQSPQFTAGTSDKPTLAYVSEHKGHIQLTLVSPGPGKPTLKGACVFVTGNHGRAEVSVETPLDVLYIESGGQQSQVTVLVDNRGRIGQPRVFLNGIQERVTITGPQEAALGCAQLTRSMSGSHTDVTCQATTP